MSDRPSPRRAPAAPPHSTTPPVAGGITRRRVLQGAAGAAVVATTGWAGRAAAQSASLPFAGLNLSGLASNSYVENAEIGTHYRAITAQHVAAAGSCPLFRLPTTAARFTRGQGAPLNESYCKQVQDALDNIAARGKRAIVELHDYMRLPQRVAAKSGYRRDASGAVVDARGNRVGDLAAAELWADTYPLRNFNYVGYLDSRDQLLKLYEYRVIGTPGCTLYNDAGLPDLWARIVNRFKQHPAVFGWGVMNEPYQGAERNADGTVLSMAAHWQKTATACTKTIIDRDRNHFVFVCGNGYASARRWQDDSMDLFDIPDPYDRIVYEAHNYLDNNGSGGGNWIGPGGRNEVIQPDTGINMVSPFIEALQQAGKRGYLGEHGYPAGNRSAEIATTRMLAHLQAYNIPSTQWCFGPGWPDDDVLGMSRDVGADIQAKANLAAVQAFFDVRLSSYILPR
ncbi:glycoside hydrolase family 5 protein [Xanthomonas citri]|uniref:glycoside hydrolase family 5 protein n=1 Tax=Xanthomonas citri TaxID=346 RepID=UPI000C07690D|nr:cellulase family glycosylhydrolase [Xanthomonas citri]MCT8357515.1 glycoside hydrolase family 5 protein [Xanthomonas citri pv. anacardii]MCT8361595.1 glycoside hydrolase family 5 protein [Xanthomonas citri pv. anacardii]MCT8365929.1 glycoside hydrolase family 5 protein [Xanthomonas citri pv. anacardii]MCT8369539.1 glycoside hydrolase family 5 protein [Xanthomonas citri pv. anacardii]MCT8373575.1 glycoside hydrolase family 5 protein [Xanthomonas citri pv. anacardii]